MTRLMMALSLVLILAFAPLTDAKSSSSSSSSSTGGGYQGQIQSVTTTNFSMGTRGGRHRRRGGTKPVQVHYNPSTTTVTIDGAVVNSLDYRATGKYAVVSGTMKNNILEATTISVTTAAPARHNKKSKSSQ